MEHTFVLFMTGWFHPSTEYYKYGIFPLFNLVSKYGEIFFVSPDLVLYRSPFGFSELSVVNWESLPLPIMYRIGFIIVFTSFMTYMFNLFAIKELKPTTLSIFIYLQPVIASSYALLVGSDSLNFIKIGSTILIFIGVYLVTRKPKEAWDWHDYNGSLHEN